MYKRDWNKFYENFESIKLEIDFQKHCFTFTFATEKYRDKVTVPLERSIERSFLEQQKQHSSGRYHSKILHDTPLRY